MPHRPAQLQPSPPNTPTAFLSPSLLHTLTAARLCDTLMALSSPSTPPCRPTTRTRGASMVLPEIEVLVYVDAAPLPHFSIRPASFVATHRL